MGYDAIDDDELLAPLGYSQEDPADDEESDELQGEWHFAHGFPDTRRSVRIWVDEDTRHLTKVRLSTRWRDRLGTHRLEDAFAEAFFLANARVGDVPTLQPPALEECEGDPSLTWDDYPQIEEKIQSLLDKASSSPRATRSTSAGPISRVSRSQPPAPTETSPSPSRLQGSPIRCASTRPGSQRPG